MGKRIGFKNVEITGEAAPPDQGAADKLPGAVVKIIEEKGCRPEQVLMQVKVFYSGKSTTKDIYQ